MERLFKYVEKFLENHRFVRRWRKIIAVLTAMAVFITTYSMILPAISLETDQGPEIGLFADTSGDESAPDGSTVTDSIPEAGAQGDVLTAETASLPAETESVPEELSTETLPEENAPAESIPAEITPTETVSEEAAPAATETPAPKVEELSAVPEEPAYLENEKLVFDNNSFKLTLTVPAAAKVVKGATLDVREIGQPFANDGLDENGRKNEYLSYLAAAETALNLTAEEIAYIEKNIVNTPAAELPWARFFAISVKNADGAIAPACTLPVEIIYKNTAETAADGLKVMCLLPNGTMTMVGSETKVATAAQTPIALLSAADSNFDITSKFVDAGTLTFGTFAVQVSEIDAAIEKEKEEAAKAAAEAAKAESASGTESVPAESSAAPAAESVAPATESSVAETAESSAEESVPAEDASVSEPAESGESLPEDASEAESAEESLPAEAEDESLVEEAEKTEEKAEIQEQPKADDKATKTLVTKGADYTVTMTYTADAKIPAGARLSAKEILPTAYNYKGYMNKAVDALGLSEDEAAYARARFFDIKIMLGATEVTPAAAVRVDIEYKTPQELASAENMKAVHFGNEGPQEVAISEVTTDKETAEVSGVAFEAGSFSVYGVVYTVDFTYDGYTFSIDGGSDIKLSKIIEILGLGIDVKNVADVIFSDPNLVSVEKTWFGLGNDWILKSLNPFTTEETLTVFMADGTKFVISVHDLQYTNSLNDVLTGVTISGAEWDAANNQYVVKNGKNYSVHMTFQEGEAAGQYQFSNDGWMTLTLPDGVTFKAEGRTFPITVNEAGEHFTINGNQLETVGNTIRVKLNSGDPNYQKLKDLTTATFSIDVNGEFDSSHNEYTIDGKTDTKVKVDSANDVTIQKAGALTDWNSDPNYAKVTYTLRVVSNGTNNNVKIQDVISGNVITYNGDAVVKKESTGETVNWTTTSTSSSGFSMTTGEMKDGEVYTITYTANINKSSLNSENGSFALDSDSKNTVTWDGTHPSTYDLGHVVTAPGISKGAGNVTVDGDNRTIPWTITAYSDYGTANQLTSVTDTIKTEGMHYAGDYVTVKVYDAVTNAQVGNTKTIQWSELGVNKNTSKTFTLDILSKIGDNTGKKYKYEISYTTSYNAGSLTDYTNVSNGYEDNRDNDGTGTAGIGPNPENTTGVRKTMEGTANTDGKTVVTWHITVTVPKVGLTAEQAVVTDTLPKAGAYIDSYVSDSLRVVSGLQSGETAYINTDATNNEKVVINFTKNGTDLGLNAASNKREVVLELKTICNADWIAAVNEENSTLNPTHTNYVEFNKNYDNASYTPAESRFEKGGSQNGFTDDGLPKFSYQLLMGVISEELFANGSSEIIKTDGSRKYIELVDEFDDRLSFISGSAKIYGGDTRFSVGSGETSLPATRAVYDQANHTVTFRLYQDELPQNGSSLYSYYKVTYDLQVKDRTTYDAMQEAVTTSETHKLTLTNSATGFGNITFPIEYDPNVLDKSHVSLGDGKLQFTVTVNEAGLTLTDNGVLVLTDKMTNLSVRYQDVTITVEDNITVETKDAEGNPVTAPYFNMKGDTITFYVPDGVKTTITYVAKAKGEPDGNGQIHYHNEVDMLGFHKEDDGYENYVSDATGYGTNYGLNLYKGDGLVNSTGLAGAVFKLFEADEVDADGNIISGSPVKNADGSDYTVTTSDGRDGSAVGTGMIMGTEDLGWNLKPEKRYYLLEIVAPPGYALDNTKYSFVISKEGHVNYTRYPVVSPDGSGAIVQPWTYYNGDIVTVKNWRKDGVLTLTKSFAGLNTEEPDDDQKAAISFEVYKLNSETGDYELFRTIVFNQMIKNAEGKYTYTIGDLPEGQYKVVELVDDVTCKETVYAVEDNDQEGAANNEPADRTERYATVKISETDVKDNTEHTVDISNTYNVPSEYKIYKYGSPANVEGETSYKLAGAKFAVYATDNTYAITGEALRTYETNSRGRFSILQTDVIRGGGTYAYDTLYAVQETDAPDGFEVNETVYYFYFLRQGEERLTSGLPEGTVQISYMGVGTSEISDAPSTTYIEAKKKWLDDLLEETNDTTPVRVRIRQIASYDKEGSVVEPALSGYYSAASEGPVDAERATTFMISKATGTWQLTKDVVEDVKLVDGKLTKLPTMTFDNHMPIYYTYKVEEIEPDGYSAFYEHEKLNDGGVSATVSNRPRTVTSITKVTAKKKWVNINGEDVTDKMGLDDTVEVKVYRTTGILTRGTIYDGDVMKDPSQQFAMTFEDRTGKGALNTSSVLFLPGDTVRITIKPVSIATGKTFDDLTEPNIRSNWDTFKQGSDYKHIKDTANRQFVFEFTSRSDSNNRHIYVEQFGEVNSFDMIIENISASGRTQVLTQADLAGVADKTEVETLNLMTPGWQAVSKEYPTVDRNGNVYTYFIVETNGENYGAEYSVSGEVITVTNVDKKIEVDKTWLAPNGDDITVNKEDGSITYTVKRNSYETPVPAEATVDYSGLNLTFDNGTVGVNPSNVTIPGGIRVGSTIKVNFRLPNDHSNAENSPMNGLDYSGVELVSDSGPFNVNDNGHTHAEREFTFKVTETVITLSGTLTADRNAATGLAITATIIKEPDGTYIPGSGDTPVTSGDTVGTVTVGYDSIISSEFTDAGVTAAVGTTPWSVVLSKLPDVDAVNGYTYTYYIEEAVANDFILESIDPAQGAPTGGIVQVVNKLKPGSLQVTKAVEGAEATDTFTIGVQDAEGNYYGTDGKNYGLTPHYETFSKGDTKIWQNLIPGTYTVLERDASVEGYSWTVTGTGSVKVNMNDTTPVTVKNSYYKTTEYSPKITKALKLNEEDVPEGEWPANGFEFYLSASTENQEGAKLGTREATATAAAKTAAFGAITFEKPGTYTFSIEEVQPAGTVDNVNNGIVYSTDEVTFTVVVQENVSHELYVESVKYSTDEEASTTETAINEAAGLITNTPEVKDFEFTKKWKNANGTDWDAWVKDIKVTVYRKYGDTLDADFAKTFTLRGESGTENGISWTRTGDAENGYKFIFKDLQKYASVTVDAGADSGASDSSGTSGTSGTTLETQLVEYMYYVVEEKPNGYKEPSYGNGSGTVVVNAQNAGNGGSIINTPEDAVALPDTGGPGTLIFTMLGMMLIAFAGTAYMILLRRRRASLKGGDNLR